MKTILAGLTVAIGFIAIMFVLSLILATPVYFLWNWLMPEIFRLPTITLLQALGLTLLTSLLFKSNVSSDKK